MLVAALGLHREPLLVLTAFKMYVRTMIVSEYVELVTSLRVS